MSENTNTAAKTAEKSKVRSAEAMKAVAEKAPTSLQRHYSQWLVEKTGVDLDVQSGDFAKIVQLAVTLYHDYQASPERQVERAREEAERALNAKPASKKTPEQIKAAMEKLQAQLDAAQATPATKTAGAPAATATGEASTKPAGRKTAVKK